VTAPKLRELFLLLLNNKNPTTAPTIAITIDNTPTAITTAVLSSSLSLLDFVVSALVEVVVTPMALVLSDASIRVSFQWNGFSATSGCTSSSCSSDAGGTGTSST
jgi:hypothetical protein